MQPVVRRETDKYPGRSARQKVMEDQPGQQGNPPEYIPGEEAGDAGEETQGGPMKHQGVGPGDPHDELPKGR